VRTVLPVFSYICMVNAKLCFSKEILFRALKKVGEKCENQETKDVNVNFSNTRFLAKHATAYNYVTHSYIPPHIAQIIHTWFVKIGNIERQLGVNIFQSSCQRVPVKIHDGKAGLKFN
jgi:hypothetical protein